MWSPFIFGFDLGDTCSGHRARARWEGFGGWGPQGGHGRWRGRAARLFEQGDLKYVILRLLEEKPRHGYEIIKELESRFGGSYAPSPGTVYPTLTMLEDLGYARVVPEEGGKKIYEITDEGRKHLAEHSTTVNDIFDRIARFVEGFTDTPMTELNQAFQRLARATYKTATTHIREKETLAKLREIIQRAADEIEAAAKQTP
ncbi:MAG TPA: PadR family transcriptional regulator [Gemmatimonadaceae bacterium]|jgi:DNA-binding PadR family transcriptional regulator|nr:PadR family transcriptional regulator [Gemmatimonadaceae bacterium]